MSKKDLKVTLIGDDKTGKAFKSAGDGAGKMVKALGVAGVAAAAAIGAFAAKGIKDAVQLETSLREVNSLFGLSGKAGAESFKELQSGVAGVSKEVGIAQDTLTKGLYTAISAGVPKENAFTFLADAAKLGIAGVADTETAVNALTGVMNAFQKDNLSSAEAADLLFTTVRQGKTTLAELAPAIGTVGPAAAAAGVSFKETAAALATVTKIIPNTATAAASLRQVFGEADKSGTGLNKSLKTLGAKTMAEAITKFGSFQGVMQAVYEQTGSSDVAFKNLFGSTEAAGAALTMVGTNAATAAADLAAMDASAGNSNLAFEEMNKSVARNMEQLKVTFQNLGIEVGNKILPLINAGIAKISAWWDANGPMIRGHIDTLVVAFSAFWAALREGDVTSDGLVGKFEMVGDALHRVGKVAIPIAVAALGQFVAAAKKVGEALLATIDFFRKHDNAAKALGVVVAAVTAAVVAAWVYQAAQAAIASAKAVVSWFKVAVGAQAAAKGTTVSTAQIVVGWATHAAKATFHAAKVVLAWLTTGTASGASAGKMVVAVGVQVAAWVLLSLNAAKNAAKVVASWVVTSAGAIKAAAVMAAQAAIMVAKWVFMGAQSLIQAARMAAAWLIAMGPIGWAIAAVVGITAVVVKNWGAIKGATVAAWSAVSSAVASAWGAIKGAVSAGVNAVVAVVTAVPRRILGALGNIGGLLVGAGGDLLRGLARGITGAIGGVVRAAVGAAKAAVNAVKGALGISSPSKVFAELGKFTGQGLALGLDKQQRNVATSAQDLVDLAGMKVGGTGYINARLGAASPAAAPPLAAGRSSLTVNINASGENIDSDRLMTLLQRAERLAGV